MKKTLLLLFTLLLALSAQSQNSLRLMTYNIKNANGMDDVCDFQRIADVINHIHPEVVALQELDSMTHRSGQKYVLGEIAGRTQMHAYFAPAIDYDGGKYGIGLLTKEIPVSLKTMTLPGREEARALIMAEFDNYIYCCTHLSLTEEDRMASLELIKDFACRSDTDRIALAVSTFGREHFLNCFFGSGITETYFTFQRHQVAMAIYVDGCQRFNI